jgi:predicted GIY-YIG superfamily endonuclease
MISGFEQPQHLVYKHTCNITNKSYIGQTSDLSSRNKSHARPSSGCVAFRNAIQKHGWDNFTHEILATGLTLEQANILEEALIAEYNTVAPFGYNIRSGGQNKLLHKTSKKKISEKLKGRKIPQEVIDKRSAKLKGRKQKPENIRKSALGRTGLTRTLEQRERMSKVQKQRFKNLVVTEETRRKMSLSRMGYTQPKLTCPHCMVTGGGGGMERWHFDNCKSLGKEI